MSRVMKRADTASLAAGSEGTLSPTRLRVIQDEGVLDRYTVGGVIGEGAGGEVHIATDKRTKQRRVIKSLVFSSNISKVEFEELVNEMEVYLRLDHPNICRLLEVYVQEDAVHLIMELCDGKELFERWDGRGRYSENDACVVVAQMLDVLQYMHSNQICHRDLKLENWVYADSSPDARLKLIDFGFSSVVAPDTPMQGVLGTAFYIAPEVLQGSYDFKCDIWSTGVITYMLLTGQPPFGFFDDPDAEIVRKIERGHPMLRDTKQWNALSSQAQHFIEWLLTREPQERPTAAEAREHEWLQEGARGDKHTQAAEIDKEVLESMRTFASTNVVKRAACCLIAYSMTVVEADHLEAQFKKLDKGRDGTIKMHEMVGALKEHLDMPDEEAQQLFSRLDLTGDRQLNYSEFLAAACQRRFLAQESLIKEAFRRFDVDHTGFISLENLRAVLGDEYNGTKVEDILAQVDPNGKGVIEYEEFVRAIMDLGTSAQGDEDVGLVKRMSRAFEFTSLGSLSNRRGSTDRTGRRRCQTADEDDVHCLADVGDEPHVGGTRSWGVKHLKTGKLEEQAAPSR